MEPWLKSQHKTMPQIRHHWLTHAVELHTFAPTDVV